MKYVTPLVFGAGLYLILLAYLVWGIVLFLLGGIILTTNYVTEIDLGRKKYRDYLSFLGLKLNMESKTFNGLDRIVITRGDYAQTINTRAQSRQLDWVDYTGTLIFDQGESLDLLTRNDKGELLEGLKEFTDFLKVRVEDRTAGFSGWIDMDKI